MSGGEQPEFRILSLAGGGYLGLYTAAVLAGIEARIGEPLGRRYDLIAGTSVGGILAIALAYEVPMERLVALFRERGEAVFSDRGLPRGAVSRLLDLTRSVLGPKYSGAALRAALAELLGKRTLKQAKHNLVIPAISVTHSHTKVFKTPHSPASEGDQGLSAVDVAMATCAAPAYFPSVQIGGELYADGGLFAVAPDQVALHEAEHFMGVDPSRVAMLSIGTATSGYQPPEGIDDESGAVGWLSGGRLILTLVSVQQQHVEAMMEDRLGERYLRLDAAWPADGGLGIDIATPQAAQVLTELAEKTLAKTPDRQLARFVGD
ncbi:MAG: patatin-like phospholipase family protein [Rhodocyclaceae bacterium]|nr:patatin-like phospholipase family protein [Rhodocyclaceae bacterium]MBX3678301.1 patatin-like phospholipase family protein [Rhodocyclaceae bacterium]MCO5098817.1 patatin-like phospholipase family protein [Rhodocyclaceae bacterium]PKO71850.1 MAG: patatin [Betaproteobacteria bacterium HGW-Betaproteobacteria-14]